MTKQPVRRTAKRKSLDDRVPRDFVLFVGGLVGMIHETVLAHAERPYLITAFLGMMGLPVWLRRDEAGQADESESEGP